MTIQQFCDVLRTSGIQGVDAYEGKLLSLEADQARLQDFACEGRVAYLFQSYGWALTLRDGPDLEARAGGFYLGIEVKHCRWKKDHDPVVEAALASSEGEFVAIPRLIDTERREEEWEQMYRFAKKNCHQYAAGEFNILFFVNHTVAHDDITLQAAAHRYEEELQNPVCPEPMKNLNGMMTIFGYRRSGNDSRSIYCEIIRGARKPLPDPLMLALYEIRDEPRILLG